MEHLEITFSRVTRYSVDLSDPKDKRALAKALDIKPKKLAQLIESGELLDDPDRRDGVCRFLDEAPSVHSILDEEDMEDLEVHTG